MSKKILFSPIGGNDPVSSATEADGSMLHICRHYKPDLVYLYLSKEMTEREEADQRYTYCVQELGKLLNHEFQCHLIMKKDLVEVQDYDFYYDEFSTILRRIEEQMEPEDLLILNIASGTPAMKSELLITSILSGKTILPIQVTTPEKSINIHRGKDKDYDPVYYWEINKDNEEGAPNRCIEVQCPNLVATLKKNIIIRHLESYNYSAALQLADEIRKDLTEEAYAAICLALSRQMLDISNVIKLSSRFKFDYLPVKQATNCKIFEYALALQIKLNRKEYGDFIRGLSPILTDLFEVLLEKKCSIKIKDYVQERKGVQFWSIDLLNETPEGQQILKALQSEFNYAFRESPVAASNLRPIITYLSDDITLKNLITSLRTVEEKVRNLAAHEIVSINDEKLKTLLGKEYTFKTIFELLKKTVCLAGIPVGKDPWNSYDQMNAAISDLIF